MCIRKIPFGYTVERGHTVIKPSEAEIVKEIFDKYISRETFKQIADSLSHRNIIYYEDNAPWNKNMIARIIDDERYVGRGDYPGIISEETYRQAKICREQRSCKQAELPTITGLIKSKLVCSHCGKKYNRKNKWSTKEKWLCSGGCKCDVYLDDITVFGGIVRAIGNIPKYIEEIPDTNSKYIPTMEVMRMTNDIYRMMGQANVEFKTVANIILDCASAKFDCCNMEINEKLSGKILGEYRDIQEKLDENFIHRAVDKILIDSLGEVTLILKSGLSIHSRRKENE